MNTEHYYHMFANGDDAKNFITSETEFKQAFNRFGVCQYVTGVTVLSCSVEESHPHSLLYGTYENCLCYSNLYADLSMRSIIRNRGSKDGVILHCELEEVTDEQYLMNVATYTIVQATKDGKAVMPYDYLYGTGSLYFRSSHAVLPWMVDNMGQYCEPKRYGDLMTIEQRKICATRIALPPDWLVCNGFVLPTNYVDVKRFESIYKTHNCFRAFLSSGKNKDLEIMTRMSNVRGLNIEDLQARELCRETCLELFKKTSTRHLDSRERLELALSLRKTYALSIRQISILVKVPESELRKYVK